MAQVGCVRDECCETALSTYLSAAAAGQRGDARAPGATWRRVRAGAMTARAAAAQGRATIGTLRVI